MHSSSFKRGVLVKEHKPLLEIILKYLVELDSNGLLALALTMFADNEDNKSAKFNSVNIADAQALLDLDENIIAFELVFYSYKILMAQKNKTENVEGLVVNSGVNIAEYSSRVVDYINRIHHVLEQWHGDTKRIEIIVSFLIKIYKKQLAILEELMQASTEAINQITNFGIILNSQIVTMKNMTKKTEEQRKYTVKLSCSEIDRRTLIAEIDKNRQQISDIARLELYASAKVFPTLVKKLKHDYEIFYSKHRFMEEEFKIFLNERYSLAHDSVYSELSAANIYDLLKRIQRNIAKEIEFGGGNA